MISLIMSLDNTTNDEHHHNESEAIELNNGKKWQVDKNMLIHIRIWKKMLFLLLIVS
jgi:hypothetical protein